jgi:hypothetical protein
MSKQLAAGLRLTISALWLSGAHLALVAQAQDTEIVPFGSEWTYLNWQGGVVDSLPDNDPNFEDNWFMRDYDETNPNAWEGPAPSPMSYGGILAWEDGPATELEAPPSGDRFTAYFRHEFETTEAMNVLAVEFLSTHGSVFYLDGQQVLNFNCCVDPETDEITADDRYGFFAPRDGIVGDFVTRGILDGQQLAPGPHLLAVSVHMSDSDEDALGFETRLVSRGHVEPVEGQVVIGGGVDTYITESAKSGPDGTYGGEIEFEWDGADGGGRNHGLIHFDVPRQVLDGFNGNATLRILATNGGDDANLHRMTVDWLAGSAGGNDVTWNNIPGGPGVVIGQNAVEAPTVATGDVEEGTILELDVTEDVRAWAAGEPNYGWAIVPLADVTGGVRASSFEDVGMVASFDEPPKLILTGVETSTELQAGDANEDLKFDQVDLVQVQIAAKYLTGQTATWGEGDWNGAPGGSPGSPPDGDGQFNQRDIVASQQAGVYLTGPYAAVRPHPEGTGNATLVYDPASGELSVRAGATELTSINIDSAAAVFTGESAQNLGGSFDNDGDNNIFKATFGSSFGSLTFGNVAQTGLSEDFLLNDLTVIGSLDGGGDLGDVDLIYVPEPSALALFLLGAFVLGLCVRGRRNSCGRRT